MKHIAILLLATSCAGPALAHGDEDHGADAKKGAAAARPATAASTATTEAAPITPAQSMRTPIIWLSLLEVEIQSDHGRSLRNKPTVLLLRAAKAIILPMNALVEDIVEIQADDAAPVRHARERVVLGEEPQLLGVADQRGVLQQVGLLLGVVDTVLDVLSESSPPAAEARPVRRIPID